VEGRDEKGIKKTVSGLLKILHPSTSPSDEEFEEYVSYAMECRRRVKEQMNKRKTDDEFALINLSYFSANGEEKVVFCPESQSASATQEPSRKNIHTDEAGDFEAKPGPPPKAPQSVELQPETSEPMVAEAPQQPSELQEQHFTIHYGDTGYSYESLIGPYLVGAKKVEVEDPYIRATHQVQNFIRFCEAVLKAPTIRKIVLTTSYDDDTDVKQLSERLSELKQSLIEIDVELEVKVNEHMHDREIRVDNGWVVKIGRGLDFYQKPDNWFSIGVNDLMLRKCLETKVDIFKG
jgi:ATP-dependent Lon protease